MTETQAETLRSVIRTLDTIPVSGAQNLDRMLGCIRVLLDMLDSTVKTAGDA